LHTNLGRAPLSDAAIEAMLRVARYSALELSSTTGERRSRQYHVEPLLTALTGAEAAYATVNNAAAVLLAVRVLAAGKQVLVSRGQAVEIGGGFRIPAILEESGSTLVEVGTTNRTRLDDFENAITPQTGAILHVHTSNFKMVGFVESVSISELGALSRDAGVPLLVDNGSGALLDSARFGMPHEPMPAEAVAAGATVVAFSGDKLLGGPQAGILIGRSTAIERIARHPLARALRPDKVTLAGLAATLRSYAHGRAQIDLPVWRMIATSHVSLEERATRWRDRAHACGLHIEIVPGESTVGGGSLPGEVLPTSLLVLPDGITADRLRAGEPMVLARERQGRVHLDLRTIDPADDDVLFRAVVSACR
jgi:L-seryl-tRNA(Ser) seleniumtransferase